MITLCTPPYSASAQQELYPLWSRVQFTRLFNAIIPDGHAVRWSLRRDDADNRLVHDRFDVGNQAPVGSVPRSEI